MRELTLIRLIEGNCLDIFPKIDDKSIDFILTDPPYGTTACKWDSVIPFEPMWKELKRIIKDNGCIALFGTEPFSSYLRISNIKNYKYDWIWKKKNSTGYFNAKKQPLRNTEIISCFYNKQTKYFPQFTKGKPYKIKQGKTAQTYNPNSKEIIITDNNGYRYPLNLIEFNSDKEKLHPTQKPVPLLEYLIKTYTNENDTVLDFTMGSGTTGVACQNLNRNFIGIEKDKTYYKLASNRLKSSVGGNG